jgi:hypothetical protein
MVGRNPAGLEHELPDLISATVAVGIIKNTWVET